MFVATAMETSDSGLVSDNTFIYSSYDVPLALPLHLYPKSTTTEATRYHRLVASGSGVLGSIRRLQGLPNGFRRCVVPPV